MPGFISLTHQGTDRKFTLPLSAIGAIESTTIGGKPYATLVLTLTTTRHVVEESHEQILSLMEEAQVS